MRVFRNYIILNIKFVTFIMQEVNMERIWRIAGLNIQQGEKVQTEIPVYDTKTEMEKQF